jgi:nucleotide-binding universal stress UspA family protein
MPGWNNICCAVDFSDESRFAMEEAAELASRSGGELTLIHVVGENRRHDTEPPYLSDILRARVGDVNRRLEEWRTEAERILKRQVAASILTGPAVETILRFAREGRHDLIVLGTPGALGCERTVFGSVAEGVTRRSPCSVLMARRRSASPSR